MKCSNCGSSNLLETDFPLKVDGMHPECVVHQASINVYVCLNCGHYEIYSTKDLNKIKSIRNELIDMQKLLEHCENQKKSFAENSNQQIDKIRNEILDLRKKSANLDITVREKNKIDERIISLNNKISDLTNKQSIALKNLEKEIKNIKEKILKIKNEIHTYIFGNYTYY